MSAADRPAVLGGAPLFPDGLPLVRPTIEDTADLAARLKAVLDSGMLTNGPTVRRLEDTVAGRLGVRHAVAVSNCTSGLMLTLQALGSSGRVVLPSFTFAASAHAVRWAGGTPVWADVDRQRLTVDPADVESVVDGACAISATHVYGNPCQVEALTEVARRADVPLIYDAAHALGSLRAGRPVGGFGDAEVFSLSPTKVLVAGEGGVVTTNDDGLADALRLGRDYGNPGDYDCRFPGLNARLSELHATVALAGLEHLDERIARRGELVKAFKQAVGDLPGIEFQHVDTGDVSTYKDLTLIIDPERFGLDVVTCTGALRAEGIDSRRYYHPPIHRQKAYADIPAERELPVTEDVAERVITPPLWSHMTDEQVLTVAAAFHRMHAAADEITASQS
jgi:dTDP-4-amino-4,6-dideoxygalactose transaminase